MADPVRVNIETWASNEVDRLKAEVARLRERAERAERERDAYLRMLTPENAGGLWYAATGRLDPFVVSWTAMELDGPWHDRADAFAAVRKKAGLDAAPADQEGGGR
jgi:hypothetical protein